MFAGRSFEDQRNDILVVGNRKGTWVAVGDKEVGLDDPEFSENLNSQYTNYHSRNVDIESIYNPEAANYIGRHLMTYIQEPNIGTTDRAKWLSFNVLNKYRNIENRIDFSLIGDTEVGIEAKSNRLQRTLLNGKNAATLLAQQLHFAQDIEQLVSMNAEDMD